MDDPEAQLPGPSEVEFGAHLRQLREAVGLELDELAERCGLTSQTLRAVESGQHAADRDCLIALAAGLGVRTSVMFSLWERGTLARLIDAEE